MRILHLANHCNRASGHVHVSVDMACTQVKQNHIVAYACSGGDYVELLQKSGVQVFFLAEPHRNLKQFFSALGQFNYILCSRENPEVRGVYDAEIIRNLIAPILPVFRHFFVQEVQHCGAEILEACVAFVVGDVSVHESAQSFNRIEVWAVGRDEMEFHPTIRPRQPGVDQFCMVISRIVRKDVDQPHSGIHRFDHRQQQDCACGIHRQHILHDGLAGLKVDGAMDVHAVTAATLFYRDRNFFRGPTANRPHRMGRMHGISKDHRFIASKLVQQIFIRLDKRRPPLRIKLALYCLRLAMLHAQPMQQRDQAATALVLTAKFGRDPGANRTRRARQGRGDPVDQLGLLFIVQATSTALIAEARQPPDPVLLIQQTPCTDRIVVQQQNLGDRRVTHSLVKQNQRARTSSQAMRCRAVLRQLDQTGRVASSRKPCRFMPPIRINPTVDGK